MKSFIYIISLIALLGCNETNKTTAPEAHLHEAAKSNELMLSESQIRLANIITQKASAGNLEKQVSVNARLVTNEDRTELVSARIQGRIERLFEKESGKLIRKGDPLYELYSEQLLTLQNDFLLAQAQYDEFGSARYEDYLKLARKKLVLYGLTEKQVDDLAGIKIVQTRFMFLAPTSGIIKEISITEGQYVNEGDVLYQLEDTNQLWVEAELYPDENSGLQVGASVIIRVSGYENSPVESKVLFISPEYRANSQVITVRSSIPNTERKFNAGMQAQVFLKDIRSNVILLPLDAVIRDQYGAYVFIQTDAFTFAPRMVKTGAETMTNIEIKEGIAEGDTVVISGAYLLYSELILKNGNESLIHFNHEEK
jgi:membrane fusion protein, copper/silver efflux system